MAQDNHSSPAEAETNRSASDPLGDLGAAALHEELGRARWVGATAGWNAAIESIREYLAGRIAR